ncbi:MAG: electron transport complex subunit E [bacterium]
MPTTWKDFTTGIIRENPTLRLMIGLCPTLAVSTTATGALGMGLATTFVLVGSNLSISLFRKLIPIELRIPIFIVIISTFVTTIDYVMMAYFPAIHRTLGVYVPLIVVNCIILGRAEAFAYHHTALSSILDGLGMGTGFTGGITLLGIFREVLGNNTFFQVSALGTHFQPMILMILPPGAFLLIGFLIAGLNAVTRKGGKG